MFTNFQGKYVPVRNQWQAHVCMRESGVLLSESPNTPTTTTMRKRWWHWRQRDSRLKFCAGPAGVSASVTTWISYNNQLSRQNAATGDKRGAAVTDECAGVGAEKHAAITRKHPDSRAIIKDVSNVNTSLESCQLPTFDSLVLPMLITCGIRFRPRHVSTLF